MFAAKRKNGTASNRKELYDLNISFINKKGVSLSSIKNIGTQAKPNAIATGIRKITRIINKGNIIPATSTGVMKRHSYII